MADDNAGDPFADPNYPDRPQHPDFLRLSEVILGHDAHASEGGSSISLLRKSVDLESLVYMATARIDHLPIHLADSQKGPFLALFFDAFLLGVDYQKAGGGQGE